MATATNTMSVELARPTVQVEPLRVTARRRKQAGNLAEGDRLGAWRIERELGRGGMGTVYAVVHNGFGKRAALKLCHKNVIGPSFTVETFLREATIVHMIDHPGVVDVFATGTYDSRPYLAMERLAGQTLGAALDSSTLSRVDQLDVLLELCDVLAAAHRAGVVHRDLKLDNVFLLDAPGSSGRRTKLLDWGVARIMGEPDPLRGMIAGTLTYVAPEQVRSDDVTPAVDVYSLGVLAYLVLTGEAPFKSDSDLELIKQHLNATPPRLTWQGVDTKLGTELADLLVRMLAKQPADRPSLDEITRVLQASRAALTPKRSWLSGLAGMPLAPPSDPFGRPAPLYATVADAPRRLMGAVLGVAALVASGAMWLIG